VRLADRHECFMSSRAQRLRRKLIVFWTVVGLTSGLVLVVALWPG
jgi:hypothetical protein